MLLNPQIAKYISKGRGRLWRRRLRLCECSKIEHCYGTVASVGSVVLSAHFERLSSLPYVEFMYSFMEKRGLGYLLKFATMMGMGRVIQRTPQMAHRDPTSLPPGVLGDISP